MFSIKDKVIVVTGGNGLLGKRMVQRLNDGEAIVVSADVQNISNGLHNIYLDITDEASVHDAVDKITRQFGKIDGWVNNAYPRTKDWGNKLENVQFESWRKNVDMHLNGYFLCSKVVLDQMKRQNSGSVINMGSTYGVVAPDFSIYDQTEMTMPVAYSAIKGGIINLTRYLAAYYGPFGVRVNSISPGGIFDNQNDIFVANYKKKVPLKRMGTPDDIAASAHFLLSDDASYITGHNLLVDGGWCIV